MNREGPSILRPRFDSLCGYNLERTPSFCKFNLGSPKSCLGRRGPRGPTTFVLAHECPYTPSNAVEVTFRNWAALFPDTEVSDDPGGGWIVLFTKQHE
jgi:hypothetical protein